MDQINPSPYLKRPFPDLSPLPLERSDPHPMDYPIHWILHLGQIRGEEGPIFLDYEDMIRLYGLENEPYVSRYGIDILDDFGSVHLYPPSPKDPHPPRTMRHLRAGEMRVSKAYRRLIETGTLYKRGVYPKNISDPQKEKSPGLKMLLSLTSAIKPIRE